MRQKIQFLTNFSGKLDNLTSAEVSEPNNFFFPPSQKYFIKYFGLNLSLEAGGEGGNANDNSKSLSC